MSAPLETPTDREQLDFAPSRGAHRVSLSRSLSVLALITCTPLLSACSSTGDDDDADADDLTQAMPDAGGGDECEMTEIRIANDGATHVDEGSELEFGNNPPASGNHYPVWTRFEAFDPEIVERGYWIHNLEHGGIVLLHGPSADAIEVQRLLATYDTIPEDPECDHKRAVLTADPDLSDPIAVVAWNYVLSGDCVNAEQILNFVDDHRGAAPENICTHGSHVP